MATRTRSRRRHDGSVATRTRSRRVTTDPWRQELDPVASWIPSRQDGSVATRGGPLRGDGVRCDSTSSVLPHHLSTRCGSSTVNVLTGSCVKGRVGGVKALTGGRAQASLPPTPHAPRGGRRAQRTRGTVRGGGRRPPPLAQLGGNAGRSREGRQAFSNTSTDSGSSPQSKFACATTLLPGMLIASSLPSATIGSDNRQ